MNFVLEGFLTLLFLSTIVALFVVGMTLLVSLVAWFATNLPALVALTVLLALAWSLDSKSA